MEVKEGKTYLTVPHEGGKLTFQYPFFKGYFGDIVNSIEKAGLKKPNSSKTASLVYDAFKNPSGKYESEIIDIMNNYWFGEFTGNLYLPKSNEEVNNGVIIDNNPIIQNGKLIMNKNDLIKRLKENDSNVKFVPFGFKTGTQNLIELQKNHYIIARYGEEGAEKIAEIASKYKNNPYLWSFDSVDKEEVRLSALSRYRDFDIGLIVDGDSLSDCGNSHAFGIVK
jgi:hypothetical protein